MNQLSWTYLADYGKQHRVGLAHGPQSGHLLVHCNAKVILIDFKVFENATYSIFIDEQLCEIAIEKKGEQFYYSFEINNQADTPRNRARKKIEKKHLLQSVAFLGTLVLVISVVLLSINYWNGHNDLGNIASNLQEISEETNARVLISKEDDEWTANYFFIVNNKSYSSRIPITNHQNHFLKNGMPLEADDEFIVSYDPRNPKINSIDFDRPTTPQITRYQQKVTDQLSEFYPQFSHKTNNCVVIQIYTLRGIPGLADLYFQQTSKEKNARHNAGTYQQLMERIEIQALLSEKCGFDQ